MCKYSCIFYSLKIFDWFDAIYYKLDISGAMSDCLVYGMSGDSRSVYSGLLTLQSPQGGNTFPMYCLLLGMWHQHWGLNDMTLYVNVTFQYAPVGKENYYFIFKAINIVLI